ncbi:MAG: PLP-dependent aminotransferase family protein [Opitutaceae bacterium]|nr:PLP-dependent aminotransferase family protein [Opitutaceae bacterium]
MPRSRLFPSLTLGVRPAKTTIFRWLYDELRRAILDRRLRAGEKLPSTRGLAKQYQVARGTVVAVFEQLAAEGYIEPRRGSGATVKRTLPEKYSEVSSPLMRGTVRPSAAFLSPRGLRFVRATLPVSQTPVRSAFQTDQPALDLFPTALWGRIASRCLRGAQRSLLASGQALGYLPLREALADYLRSVRGIKCSHEAIVITSGTQHSLDLISRLILDQGDCVWMEDPGYPRAASLFRALGAKVVALPVDSEGLDCAAGRGRARRARLAYVTPAHQFPLGVTMSISRRLELLRWAQSGNSWIFEDDYDGEFRFASRPLAALQSLDESGCVIYASSFSKMMFPTLRLGYMVVPQRLIEPIAAARSLIDLFPPVLDQAVMCEFITEGHFGRHLRRMREIYARRLEVLQSAASVKLDGLLQLTSTRAGLQAIGWLHRSIRAEDAELAASARGINVVPLSRFAIERPTRNGLMLGFAMADERILRQGVEELARVLRSLKNQPPGRRA